MSAAPHETAPASSPAAVHGASAPEASTPRAGLAVPLLLGVLALLALRHPLALVFDDAYISFRYSRHLAEGHGLVFNIGEDPPVEGYSNLLWVLWCAVAELLAIDVTRWATLSLLACAVLLLFLVLRTARAAGVGALGLVAAGLFLGLSPTVALYSTGGLETMAFALAIFLTWERLLADTDRPRGLAAGLAALAACLLRPDAPVFIGIIGLLALVRARRCVPLRRAIAVGAGVLVLGVAALLAFRLSYHHDWLPNTARVKGNFSPLTVERGGKYALAYLAHFPFVAVIATLCAGLALRRRRAPGAGAGAQPSEDPGVAHARHAVLLVAVTFAYATFIGGDFLPFGRFLLPALPFAALLLARAVDRSRVAFGVAALGCALTALPAYEIHPTPRALRAAAHYNWNFAEYVTERELVRGERRRAEYWALLGRALAAKLPATDSLVQDSVGAVGYHCDLFLYDQFGLTDREVARREANEGRISAGHEKYVRPEHFEPRGPRWMNAEVVEVDDAGQPLKARRPGRYLRDYVPLDPADGFPENRALMLGRMRTQPSYFAGPEGK